MTDHQPKGKCKYCYKLRNRHKANVGDFFIIRRRVLRSSPQLRDSHLHICIGGLDFGAVIITSFFMVIVAVAISLLYTFTTAHRNLTALVIDLAVLTILTTVMVGIVGNLLGIVGNLVGSLRPSYGELLLLLSQGSVPSECDSTRRQCLLDSALKLYSINSCSRDGYHEFLKWINDTKRSSCDYCELAIQLEQLLYKNIKWRICQRMWGAIVWIWTEPPRASWKLES